MTVLIQTPRLLLRPSTLQDAPAMQKAIEESMDELRPFMPWAKNAPRLSDTEDFLQKAEASWMVQNNDEDMFWQMSVIDKNTQEFLGAIGFHHFDWPTLSLETGYWIRTSQSGHGFMTEALNAITQYAFKELNAKSLYIVCAKNNIRSQRIPERLGYTLETPSKDDLLSFVRHSLEGLPALEVII